MQAVPRYNDFKEKMDSLPVLQPEAELISSTLPPVQKL
jgi:hypothetical protein